MPVFSEVMTKSVAQRGDDNEFWRGSSFGPELGLEDEPRDRTEDNIGPIRSMGHCRVSNSINFPSPGARS